MYIVFVSIKKHHSNDIKQLMRKDIILDKIVFMPFSIFALKRF